MKAIQVTSSLLELLDPFFRLQDIVFRKHGYRRTSLCDCVYLGNHHMAIKGAAAIRSFGLLNMLTNLGDHGRAKGQVRHKVAVHDVDMQPVRAMLDGI